MDSLFFDCSCWGPGVVHICFGVGGTLLDVTVTGVCDTLCSQPANRSDSGRSVGSLILGFCGVSTVFFQEAILSVTGSAVGSLSVWSTTFVLALTGVIFTTCFTWSYKKKKTSLQVRPVIGSESVINIAHISPAIAIRSMWPERKKNVQKKGMISMRILIVFYTIQQIILNVLPNFKILGRVVPEKCWMGKKIKRKEKSLHTDTDKHLYNLYILHMPGV